MSNNLEEVKAVVDKLNALVLNLPEKYLTTQEYGDPYFSFAYNEIGMIITFKEEVLWCSENDDRDYDDENNDWYETLYEYVVRHFSARLEMHKLIEHWIK